MIRLIFLYIGDSCCELYSESHEEFFSSVKVWILLRKPIKWQEISRNLVEKIIGDRAVPPDIPCQNDKVLGNCRELP
jgi:hypothetical protein